MYDAGTLDQRVTLQGLSGAVDELNQPIPDDWVDVVTVWASVRYLSGLEAVRSDAPVGVTRCSVRIVWRAGVESGMRLQHDGIVFDIKSVLPDASGRDHIDMVCETGQNQG